MKKVRNGHFNFDDKCWATISDNAKDFISKLLTYKPEDRPSADQALRHAWLVELSHIAIDETLAINALDNLKGFRVEQTLK
jgi:serine/threonine protein kinase